MILRPVPEIHLDTSFLIRSLVPGSEEGKLLRGWLRSGRSIAISTLVWGEFLCGPLEDGLEPIARRITRKHVSLETTEATEAARLFNATGRRRGSFQDCIVAATAITSGAVLATSDMADFGRFAVEGLQLAE